MKQLIINTLDELEAFICDESISKEHRLQVFKTALKDYLFHIILVKQEDENEINDENNKLVENMKRLINNIRETPEQINFIGFWVQYK